MRRRFALKLNLLSLSTWTLLIALVALTQMPLQLWWGESLGLSSVVLSLGLLISQVPASSVVGADGQRSLLPLSMTWVATMLVVESPMYTVFMVCLAALLREVLHRKLYRYLDLILGREALAALLGYFVFTAVATSDSSITGPTQASLHDLLGAFAAALTYWGAHLLLARLARHFYGQSTLSSLVFVDLGVHSRLALLLVFSGPLVALSTLATELASFTAIVPVLSIWYAARVMDRSRHEALTDQLTGIGNRTAFWSKCAQAVDAARSNQGRVAVFMLDVDRFKEINDTLGHEAGDIVIRSIAQRLSTELPAGVQAFRLGGDEFTLIVTDFEVPGQINSLASEVLDLVSRPIEDGSLSTDVFTKPTKLVVSTSAGIALFPEHGEDAHRLLKHADVAMYRAKEDRNTFHVFDQIGDAPDTHGLELLADMHESVSRGIFELFYQPKINLQTQQVVGIEALMRWKHPEYGMISPEEFIPMAENSGLIVPLTEMMFQDSLFDLRQLHASGHQIDLSVNISARMVSNRNMAAWLESVLEMSQASLSHLILEITEGTLVRDADQATEILRGLRERGARVSIDDYGTGFSSLSRLVALHPDELKIDKSFVMAIDDPINCSIVRSTIHLCNNLGIKVVAEGVETIEVARQLQVMGCDIAQGYLYGKPMNMDDLMVWLQEHNAQWRQDVPAVGIARVAENALL